MEGKSMEDACNAQYAALSYASCSRCSQQNNNTSASTANVATASSPAPMDTIKSIEVNRKTYYSAPPAPYSSPTPVDFAEIAMAAPLLVPADSDTPFEHHTYKAFMALNSPSHVSLNWSSYTCSLDGINTSPEPIAYTATYTPVNMLADSPFILDTGAICHISPVKLDFRSLHPIAPHPIISIFEAQVHTTGVGSIELCIVSNHKVMLEDILFVPISMIHLISVLCLNNSGCYTSLFDSNSCWVINKAGAVVL